MEDRDDVEIRDLMNRFSNEAEKTVKLIEALRERAITLAHKGENILIPEIKQNVRKHAKTEIEEITEKLVSINIDLELDYIDCPDLVIPYFPSAENTVYKLQFLSGDNPWNFWLVDRSVDTKVILKNILHKFQNNLLDPVKKPKAAQSVCFIDRNKVIRGIILQIKNENWIKLVDCDSNMTKVVTSDKLYKIDEDACNVHASALRCTISEEPDAIELWKNSDLRDMFCNTLREASLEVKILNRVAGSFPMFVVDIELKTEEEEATASLREWILDRLLPELKKLASSENDPICDYLSEESLSPYYKGGSDKESGHKVPQSADIKENINIPIGKNDELNNLNFPSDKLSEKMVTHLSLSKEQNTTTQEINNFEQKTLASPEEGIISSSSGDDLITSSSKESLVSEGSHRTEPAPESRLNCHSEEFRPKPKKPVIPRLNRKYQNEKNNQSFPTYPVGLIPRPPPTHPGVQPVWSYAGQPIQQANNTSWPYQPVMQPAPAEWVEPVLTPTFSPVNHILDPNTGRNNEVNVMAPEFIPRSIGVQHTQNSNKVEFPKEPITLRKSATLIKENENLLVMISYVETPSEFYVHFVNQTNKYLDKLYEDMFKYYTTREKIEFDSWREARSKLGKYCACKWPRDNHWYRAEVLDWAVGDNLVKVWFVDHGNTESLPLTHLQPLCKVFEKLPICSQACHLAKVHPVMKGEPWSEEAVDFFKSKVEVSDRVYSITVVQSSTKASKPNSFSVLLYEGKATDCSKSINDLLVENEFAWSRNSLIAQSTSSLSSETYHSMDELSDELSSKLSSLDFHLRMASDASRDTEFSDKLSNKLSSLDFDLRMTSDAGGDKESSDKVSNEVLLLDLDLPMPSNVGAFMESSLLSRERNPSLQTSCDQDNDVAVPELSEDFEQWDPLREDYESARNNPAVDADDACVAVSGYSARDEARICKFYAQKGFCFKAVCHKEHSMPNPDGVTTDKEEVYVGAFSQLDLPKPGEVVRLKITNVFGINLFYAQIEEKKGIAVDDESKEEAETLTSLEEFMNRGENVSRMRGLTVSPSLGEMVLARWRDEDNGNEWWYRARVIASADDSLDDNPEVMFVDYGSTCTVSERDLRKMEKRYLHLPFQAIECSLANVLPLEGDSESLQTCTDVLQEVLLGQVMTAKVYESEDVTDDVIRLHVLLELDNQTDVGDLLVERNLCQPRLLPNTFCNF